MITTSQMLPDSASLSQAITIIMKEKGRLKAELRYKVAGDYPDFTSIVRQTQKGCVANIDESRREPDRVSC